MIQRFARPVIPVSAVQYTGDNVKEIETVAGSAFVDIPRGRGAKDGSYFIYVFTGIGRKVVQIGDWVVAALSPESHDKKGYPTVHSNDAFGALFHPLKETDG